MKIIYEAGLDIRIMKLVDYCVWAGGCAMQFLPLAFSGFGQLQWCEQLDQMQARQIFRFSANPLGI